MPAQTAAFALFTMLYVLSFLMSALSIVIMIRDDFSRLRQHSFYEPLLALGIIMFLCPIINTVTALLGVWGMYNQYVRKTIPKSSAPIDLGPNAKNIMMAGSPMGQ